MDEFTRLPIEQVADIISGTTDFKPNCAVVIIDFLVSDHYGDASSFHTAPAHMREPRRLHVAAKAPNKSGFEKTESTVAVQLK